MAGWGRPVSRSVTPPVGSIVATEELTNARMCSKLRAQASTASTRSEGHCRDLPNGCSPSSLCSRVLGRCEHSVVVRDDLRAPSPVPRSAGGDATAFQAAPCLTTIVTLADTEGSRMPRFASSSTVMPPTVGGLPLVRWAEMRCLASPSHASQAEFGPILTVFGRYGEEPAAGATSHCCRPYGRPSTVVWAIALGPALLDGSMYATDGSRPARWRGAQRVSALTTLCDAVIAPERSPSRSLGPTPSPR